MFELMYYPLVHPPRRTVFEAILYWDSLTSLVPSTTLLGAYELGEDLRRLEGEGHYRQTRLEPLMVQEFHVLDRVMDTVERVIRRAEPGTLVIPDQLSADSRLWSGKLPLLVEQELRERRLLVEDDRQIGALRGNPQVLLATMACFAEEASMLIEKRSGNRVVPTTDNHYAHACATLPLEDNDARISWMVDVGQLLPVPDSDTTIAEVIRFRRDHSHELARCTEACRRLLAALRHEIDNPREVVMAFNHELSEAITDMRAAAKPRLRWAATRAAWIAVATSATTVAAIADASASLVVGGATVAGNIAVNLAIAPGRPRDDDFFYLHQLNKAFPFAKPVA